MTSTDKKVTRVTVRAYPCKTGASGQGFGTPRQISATILPGDMLFLRWKGLRKGEYINIEEVMRIARSRRVLAERATKLNAKRRRKA